MFIQPEIFKQFKNVIAAQSTRNGGLSQSPFDSLNLGLSTKDDKEIVLKNRELFFNELKIPINRVSLSTQVHGAEILKVTEPIISSGYDALITNCPNNFIAVSIADCVPILIYDSKQNAVAAIHAGWNGTVLNIVEKTLIKMRIEYNTQGENCFAFIGACISASGFEVGDEVASQFGEEFKTYNPVTNKFHVDLKLANKTQLLNFGIPLEKIQVSDYCTVTNNDTFFSYRKELGQTGRMMAIIGVGIDYFSTEI